MRRLWDESCPPLAQLERELARMQEERRAAKQREHALSPLAAIADRRRAEEAGPR